MAPNKSENQNFGASLGGRLLRNRAFFFGTFERLDITRVESPGTTATVPSAAFRNGDFSAVSTAVIDPQTGLPFPGNRIPAGRINPVAAALLNTFIPAPNKRAPTLFRYAIDGTEVSNQFDVRLDQNFNQGHTVFGRLSWKNLDRVSPTTYPSLGPRTFENPTRTFVVSDNSGDHAERAERSAVRLHERRSAQGWALFVYDPNQ